MGYTRYIINKCSVLGRKIKHISTCVTLDIKTKNVPNR